MDALTWTRVAYGSRTVYWNAPTGSGWRLTVSRADAAESGGAWRFSAYEPVPGNKAGRKVHQSGPLSTVVQARRRAEAWFAALCACHHSCAEAPATACALSGTFHVHPGEPCPVHPDAEETP